MWGFLLCQIRRRPCKASGSSLYGVLLFAPILALMSLCGVALATADMSVSPPRLELTLEPGQSVTEVIRVSNSATEKVHFKVYPMDWILSQEGEFIPIPQGSGDRSASPWITINPQEFDIAPGGTQEVRLGVKVPRDVAGGYRSVVFIESAPSQISGTFGVAVVGRIGVVVYITIAGTAVRSGNITDLTAEFDGGKGILSGKMGFENVGNVHLRLSGSVEIRDTAGTTVAKVEIPETVSLPGAYRQVPFAWHGKLSTGHYIVLAVLDYGGEVRVAGQTLLEVP